MIGIAKMKNIFLIIFNIAVIIPCLFFGHIGTEFSLLYLLLIFIISVVNLCFSKSKKELVIYNLILLISSAIGINIQGQFYFQSLADKQIWYDLEGSLTYQITTYIQIIISAFVMAIEILIKHFQIKKKKQP